MLQWVAMWKGATADQVARRFLPDKSQGVLIARRRLRVLRDAGLVASRTFDPQVPMLSWITREGLDYLELSGSVQQPSFAQLHHDLSVIDCAVWFEKATGQRIVSERQIRTTDLVRSDTQSRKYAVEPVAYKPDAKAVDSRLIFPDFVSVDDATGLVFAHEVDRTGKHTPRVETLMWSYAKAEHITRVAYYAAPKFRTRYEQIAKEVNQRAYLNGLPKSKVHVMGWEWEVT